MCWGSRSFDELWRLFFPSACPAKFCWEVTRQSCFHAHVSVQRESRLQKWFYYLFLNWHYYFQFANCVQWLIDTLCDMGFVEQFVALLQRERDSTHEHLLAALFALTNGHSAAIAECRRPEFLLRELLENRIESFVGQEEFEVFNTWLSLTFLKKILQVNSCYWITGRSRVLPAVVGRHFQRRFIRRSLIYNCY